MRIDRVIQTQTVLVAIGINLDGKRCVLGVELSNRESRSSWTDFLTSLKTRGRMRSPVGTADSGRPALSTPRTRTRA